MKERRDDLPIDTSKVLILLDQIEDHLSDLDGLNVRDMVSNNKQLNQRMAAVSRQLLMAAHLCDTAKLEVMNQYHRFKGEEPPMIVPHTDRR
jgi:hypothetical protein